MHVRGAYADIVYPSRKAWALQIGATRPAEKAEGPELSASEPRKPAQSERGIHPQKRGYSHGGPGCLAWLRLPSCCRALRLVSTCRRRESCRMELVMTRCAAQAVLCNAAGSKDEEMRNNDLLQLAPRHNPFLHPRHATSLRATGTLHAAPLSSRGGRWTPLARRRLCAVLCTHGVAARSLIGRLR